ncbi:hypothetical protein HYV86_04065 [Candidatus Woesearchaeota archaeon]|nr:hypothetical protein [Candidatus Woesearchaeota archaeon]
MRHCAAVSLFSVLMGCGSARAYDVPKPVVNPLQCDVSKVGPVPAQDHIIDPVNSFTPEEFDAMVAPIHDLPGYRQFLAGSGITYPHFLSERFSVAFNGVLYGSPLGTLNRGYGVCDEFAMLAIPFLLNMKFVRDVYLVHVRALSSPLQNEVQVAHSLVIYSTFEDRWGHISQIVGDPVYSSLDGLITALDTQSYILCDKTVQFQKAEYHLRKIDQVGGWVYNDDLSFLLNPMGENVRNQQPMPSGAIVFLHE